MPPLVSPIGLWALLRYRFDGIKFFHDMIVTDILSRATTELEENAKGLYYYFRVTSNGQMETAQTIITKLNKIKE